MVEVTIRAMFDIRPSVYDSKPQIIYGVILSYEFPKLLGGLVIPKTYSTRDYDKFMRDWGHIEEAATDAIAVKSGLIGEASGTYDITEKGLRIKDNELF